MVFGRRANGPIPDTFIRSAGIPTSKGNPSNKLIPTISNAIVTNTAASLDELELLYHKSYQNLDDDGNSLNESFGTSNSSKSDSSGESNDKYCYSALKRSSLPLHQQSLVEKRQNMKVNTLTEENLTKKSRNQKFTIVPSTGNKTFKGNLIVKEEESMSMNSFSDGCGDTSGGDNESYSSNESYDQFIDVSNASNFMNAMNNKCNHQVDQGIPFGTSDLLNSYNDLFKFDEFNHGFSFNKVHSFGHGLDEFCESMNINVDAEEKYNHSTEAKEWLDVLSFFCGVNDNSNIGLRRTLSKVSFNIC